MVYSHMAPGRLDPIEQEAANKLVCSRVPRELVDMLARPFGPDEVRNDCYRDNDTFLPNYLPITVVIRRLNDVLGPQGWSMHILKWEVAPGGHEVIATVRLQIRVEGPGPESWAWASDYDAIGQAMLKFDASQQRYWDFGKDLKAAVSDGLRKAFTLIGGGLHLYEKDENAFQGYKVHAMNNLAPGGSQSYDQDEEPPLESFGYHDGHDEHDDHGAAPAHQMMVDHVRRIMKQLGADEGEWLSALSMKSLNELSQAEAQAIMGGNHWLVQQQRQKTGAPAGVSFQDGS